jgi:hypothetical protein
MTFEPPETIQLRNYPPAFGKKFVDLFQDLVADQRGMPVLPASIPTTEEIFSSMSFEDNWGKAHMTAVCHYLRSGVHLKVPDSFRDLLPVKL